MNVIIKMIKCTPDYYERSLSFDTNQWKMGWDLQFLLLLLYSEYIAIVENTTLLLIPY